MFTTLLNFNKQIIVAKSLVIFIYSNSPLRLNQTDCRSRKEDIPFEGVKIVHFKLWLPFQQNIGCKRRSINKKYLFRIF